MPVVIGSLNGVPATDRVSANRAGAPQWITQAKADLADAEPGSARAEFLAEEVVYLERVVSGEGGQLYLYDRDSSRIVEMVGSPTADTETVITYSPGTFTSMGDFYGGGVQQVSKYLTDNVSDAMAFVHKDGVFPGENVESGGANMLRITEANDPERALVAGERLASFEAGMRADPLLASAEQDAIGFSWGLANVASSEIAGTEYDKVISLSGAGMPEGWEPNAGTMYADFSYEDLLQRAQRTGEVWEGKVPRAEPAFAHGGYYRGPEDAVLDDDRFTFTDIGVLVENHNLVATDSDDNFQVLQDVRKLVTR